MTAESFVLFERLVPPGAAEELHEDGRPRPDDDEDELEVPDAARGEPERRDVGAGPQHEEPDVVEQLPQADEEEAGARSDVADEGAHGDGGCEGNLNAGGDQLRLEFEW